MARSATATRSVSKLTTVQRVLIWVVCILGGGALLMLSVFWFGGVSGEEFSPDTFERRHFYYYEIPVVHVQCWPISRDVRKYSLNDFLSTEKLLPPPKKLSEQAWHLALLMRGAVIVREGDAQILCAYLDTNEFGGHTIWESWSKKHPELAKIFWPALAQLAHDGLYVVVPDVMELAKSATEATTFQKSLDETLAARFAELAAARMKIGHPARAAELYDEALKHVPPDHADRARLEAARKQAHDAADAQSPPAEAPLATKPPAQTGS